MPRLAQQLLANAWKENSLLPLLLRSCRDLRSARLELKWLEEHARDVARGKQLPSWKPLLERFCRSRAHGKPLQYILGTEYFGELELKCRPGVLIPRQETAAYVLHLVSLLQGNASRLPSQMRVLDLCTGSGCIPLLFAHSFPQGSLRKTSLELTGVDISPTAIELAKTNQRDQAAVYPTCAIKDINFLRANIFDEAPSKRIPSLLECLRDQRQSRWDIVISNPPYISPKQFNYTTARSVRKFEPKLALLPDAGARSLLDNEQGDLFYPRLLDIARQLDAKILLVEVGDLEQARRVAALAKTHDRWEGIEIWRDEPGTFDEDENVFEGIPIRGHGNGRSVVCWRGDAGSWLGKTKCDSML